MESPTSARVLREQRLEFSADGAVLHVRTVPPLTLNVVDAADRSVGLENVEVVAARGQSDGFLIGAGAARPSLASAQDSPAVLMPGLDQARVPSLRCFVRAPGFAWNSIEVDLSSGGERTIALDRGGEMEVLIQGEAPREARLRIYREGERLAISDLPLQRDERFQLLGLPLGPMVARIQMGSAYRPEIVLAEANVVIQTGSRASVLLVPRTFEAPETVAVAGELILPSSWELEDAMLRLVRVSPSTGSDREHDLFRLNQLRPVVSQPERYPFTAEALVPGDYVATLTELEFRKFFVVPPEGLRDLRIEIPPPVQVTVTVRDSVSGEISDLVEHLSWHQAYDGPSSFAIHPTVQRNETTRQFDLTVPACAITVGLGGPQVARHHLTFDAEEGRNVELEARRIALARVELQCEGRTIPWPGEFRWEGACVHLEGDGEVSMRGTTKSGVTFNVTEPGRYRLTLPDVEGFALHEPIEIDMSIDEIQDVIVDLEPL
ncbi:hypothetical protein Poly30_56960 [Planctomycetes bacterium Poly30]|uniref:Uncharacterized protein n=1 Tax=Saltatorellus ferox TaxID=2528018 RepID=A0A518F1D0_9BACT|nr:hypothetical protein Poly30_56960 [Planctomycetes bacterium Poly30]